MSERVKDSEIAGIIKEKANWVDTTSMDLDLAALLDLRDSRQEVATLRRAWAAMHSALDWIAPTPESGKWTDERILAEAAMEEVRRLRAAVFGPHRRPQPVVRKRGA